LRGCCNFVIFKLRKRFKALAEIEVKGMAHPKGFEPLTPRFVA
jgi:hypothetical protein